MQIPKTLNPKTSLSLYLLHSLTSPKPIFSSSLYYYSTLSPPSPNPKTHLKHFFTSLKTHISNPNPNHQLNFISALKSCSALKALSEGQQIHCYIIKTGVGTNNVFIHNSLISFYAKCGRLMVAKMMFEMGFERDVVSCNIMIGAYMRAGLVGDARKVFDEMPKKGCVGYTTMIMGLAQNGKWGEAVAVFKCMRGESVVPSEVTMAHVISSYARVGGVLDGRVLHGLSVKLGVQDLVHVATNLLHMYCVCSSLGDAVRLFEEMPEKNVVSWNVMLNGYSKGGLVELARDLFDRIPDKDFVSWGSIIDAYVRAGRLGEALMLYRSMLRVGLEPSDVMIVDLVSACGRAMAIVEGQQLHAGIVKTGFDCYDFIQSVIIHFYAACREIDLARLQFEVASKAHLATWNALLSGYVRNGMLNQARKLFDEMRERDVVTWSSIISGYSQGGEAAVALELFRGMVAAGIQPNEITMVSVLSAVASLGSLKEAKLAHEFIKKNSIPLNENLTAALIDVYAKCGSVGDALDLFNSVRNKITSVSPWNAIICGVAMHGHATLSLTIFEDLERRGVRPNSITFIGVLTACCHVGLVEAGEKYFERMKKVYKIAPTIKHYGCMVDLLGRAGRLKEAVEMIMGMPMEADVVMWGSLLAASRTHGNVEIGEKAAEILASLDTSHGASRVLLSNLYAESGKWDDALGVRKAMQGQPMIRSPGASGGA